MEREKRKKKEWVGNSLKTIVLTAAKDIAPCYCSQCCHMAEGLWALQIKGRIVKYYFLLPNKLNFITSGKYRVSSYRTAQKYRIIGHFFPKYRTNIGHFFPKYRTK